MKKYSYIIIFILGINFQNAQTSTPPSNYGTSTGLSGDPYFISSLNNLYWLSQQGGVVNATSPYWAKHYLQTANIDASSSSGWDSGAGFSPIGNNSNPFTGLYDGGSYTTDGLTINRSASSNMGFFGNNGGGTISNVNLTNISVTGSDGSGGLVGYSSGASITNCSVSGSVVGGAYTGNLIGHHNAGSISNSNSSGTVNGTDWVGGLVGYNSSSAIISTCFSSADVTCQSAGGGLVGNNELSTINNCYSRGNVTRPSGAANTRFGAFCGQNNNLIEYCYSTGSVFYDGTIPTDKGFVGYDDTPPGSYYTNNFWDSEASNQTYDNPDWSTTTTATAKTTAEMKDVATFTALVTVGLSFTAWDFELNPNNDIANEDYWGINSIYNNGYPYLSWQIFIGNDCISGSIIYNSTTGKFNFCEDGVWVEK